MPTFVLATVDVRNGIGSGPLQPTRTRNFSDALYETQAFKKLPKSVLFGLTYRKVGAHLIDRKNLRRWHHYIQRR